MNPFLLVAALAVAVQAEQPRAMAEIERHAITIHFDAILRGESRATIKGGRGSDGKPCEVSLSRGDDKSAEAPGKTYLLMATYHWGPIFVGQPLPGQVARPMSLWFAPAREKGQSAEQAFDRRYFSISITWDRFEVVERDGPPGSADRQRKRQVIFRSNGAIKSFSEELLVDDASAARYVCAFPD
jgi:hypothetical protein